MTQRYFYLSHPQVVQDPAIPVPDWPLDETGRARLATLSGASWLAAVTRIVSSTERKARETAAILGEMLGLEPVADPQMDEIDRSATGYLRPAEFRAVVARYYAAPDGAPDGWEPARAAQARILAATHRIMAEAQDNGGDTLLAGHGGVGTLLWCALAGREIAAERDQPEGGGNVFAFTGAGEVLSRWTPLERFSIL